jgi:hypothetical protein
MGSCLYLHTSEHQYLTSQESGEDAYRPSQFSQSPLFWQDIYVAPRIYLSPPRSKAITESSSSGRHAHSSQKFFARKQSSNMSYDKDGNFDPVIFIIIFQDLATNHADYTEYHTLN